MPGLTIIRTESHALPMSPALRDDVERTIARFRRAVRMAATVAVTHWPELGPLKSQERQMALEALFHATQDRPLVKYPVLDRVFGKMPSYLRRAALSAAIGAVSSFLSNYDNFLEGAVGGKERKVGAKPPRLGFSNVFPSLYGGNMLLDGNVPKPPRAEQQPDFVGPPRKRSPKQIAAAEAKAAALLTPRGHVRIKLLAASGEWRFTAPLKLKGKPKRFKGSLELSPTLMQRGAKVWLACPVELQRPVYIKNKEFSHGDPRTRRVCSVDVGINTAATAAIVDATGTVIARTFLTCGRHNDRRDALVAVIAQKQKASGGTTKGRPFCSRLYRRIAGVSLDAARRLSAQLIAFAQQHGAQAFVMEDLKGWRPNLAARRTSRWAYDGSGKVQRSKDNAQLATFATGKQYNADLNGALNIAARGLAMLLGIQPRKNEQAATGKSSGAVARMPLVLADVWDYCKGVAPAVVSASRAR